MFSIQFLYLIVDFYLFAIEEEFEVADELFFGALGDAFDDVVEGEMYFEGPDNLHGERKKERTIKIIKRRGYKGDGKIK